MKSDARTGVDDRQIPLRLVRTAQAIDLAIVIAQPKLLLSHDKGNSLLWWAI